MHAHEHTCRHTHRSSLKQISRYNDQCRSSVLNCEQTGTNHILLEPLPCSMMYHPIAQQSVMTTLIDILPLISKYTGVILAIFPFLLQFPSSSVCPRCILPPIQNTFTQTERTKWLTVSFPKRHRQRQVNEIAQASKCC